MLRPVRVVSVLSALVLVLTPLRAQNLVAICRQMSHPPVGSWATFKIIGGSSDGATLKMSIVGSESHGDSTYLWVEMAMNGLEGGRGQKFSGMSKELVGGVGPGLTRPRQVILKIGNGPAMTMPVGGPMGQMAGGDRTGFARCGEGKSLGYADVTVPAGTFHALHVQDKDAAEMWVMPNLALGLIKATRLGGGGDLVMTGHGSGAKDELTEAPVPFNPAILMQMMDGPNSH